MLDVGAGTGRVALHLARAGCTVTALDLDARLLAVLSERAREEGLDVRVIVADAARFDAGDAFDLVAVPMQTIQLLPDAAARAGFFASARRALAPGGLVALAIATEMETFGDGEVPPPDVGFSGRHALRVAADGGARDPRRHADRAPAPGDPAGRPPSTTSSCSRP